MELSRFTKMPFLAILAAPLAILTLRIIGSNSGVTPTATAKAKRKELKKPFPSKALIKKMIVTMTAMTRIINKPKFLIPISKVFCDSGRESF